MIVIRKLNSKEIFSYNHNNYCGCQGICDVQASSNCCQYLVLSNAVYKPMTSNQDLVLAINMIIKLTKLLCQPS